MSILYRVFEKTGSDKSGGVSHIHHKDSPYFVGNLTHAFVVPLTRVSRTTGDKEFGLVLTSELLHLIVVYHTGLAAEVVTHGLIEDT